MHYNYVCSFLVRSHPHAHLIVCMSFGGAPQAVCQQWDMQRHDFQCTAQQVLYLRAGHGRNATCTETIVCSFLGRGADHAHAFVCMKCGVAQQAGCLQFDKQGHDFQ